MEEKFMKQALIEARKAYGKDEVPIGAVIVKDGKVIARGHNTRQQTQNAVNHAEMIAIQKACKKVGSWRLCDCDLYVTLEPCPMCAGACINSRLNAVYFGAYDAKAGLRKNPVRLFQTKTAKIILTIKKLSLQNIAGIYFRLFKLRLLTYSRKIHIALVHLL